MRMPFVAFPMAMVFFFFEFEFEFEFGCRDYVELKIGYVERCGMRDGKI